MEVQKVARKAITETSISHYNLCYSPSSAGRNRELLSLYFHIKPAPAGRWKQGKTKEKIPIRAADKESDIR